MQEKLELENYQEAYRIMQILNSSGLCLVTAVNMMRFVSKLYERGVISKEEMGGLEVKIGDLDYYTALIEKILNREDIGAITAGGWYPLCEYLGADASTDWEAGCAIIKGADLIVGSRLWPSLLNPNPVGFNPGAGIGSTVRSKTKHTHSASFRRRRPGSLEEVRRDAERMGLTKEELDRVFTADSFNTGRLENYTGDAEKMCDILGVCYTSLQWMGYPLRDARWLAEAYSALTGSLR